MTTHNKKDDTDLMNAPVEKDENTMRGMDGEYIDSDDKKEHDEEAQDEGTFDHDKSDDL